MWGHQEVKVILLVPVVQQAAVRQELVHQAYDTVRGICYNDNQNCFRHSYRGCFRQRFGAFWKMFFRILSFDQHTFAGSRIWSCLGVIVRSYNKIIEGQSGINEDKEIYL